MCLMKKLMRTFALMAVAALGLSACTGEKLVPDNGNADGKFVTVHFGAEAAIEGATKATLTTEDELTFKSAWENGDALSVKYSFDYGATKETTATWSADKSCFEAQMEGGNGNWIYDALYPALNAEKKVDFGSARTQNGSAYNSKFDLMKGSATAENADAGKTADGKDVVFNMERQTAIAYFHFTSTLDEEVVSAKLSVEGATAYLSTSEVKANEDYAKGYAFTKTEGVASKEINLTFDAGAAPTTSDFKLWFNVLPTDYDKMILTVETANHTLTISRNATGKYEAGKLYKVVKNIPADKWVKKAAYTGGDLVFDFKTHPEGWPAETNDKAGDYDYVLSGVKYAFNLSTRVYCKGTSGDNGYLMISGKNGDALLGLPAISGFKLTKVVATINDQVSTVSSKTMVAITDGVDVIAGGAAQNWNTKGAVHTYTLTETEENTVYYMLATVANAQVMKLVLSYEPATPSATKYVVSFATVEGGSFSASPRKAEAGAEVTLTATPAEGYAFNNDWSVKGADETVIEVVDGKFVMPAQNVTVSGTFSKVAYTITKAAAVNGSFTVKNGAEEVTTAFKGDKLTLEAIPAEGFTFGKWTVTYMDGETEKSINPSANTFNMPTANVTVSATFVEAATVPVYASVAELIAAGAPTTAGTKVTVTLTDEEITKFYKSGTYTNGVYFMAGTQEVQIYCQNTPSDWKVGGTISGTLTNCEWKLFVNNKTKLETWELCPADYSELTYKAPLPTCATPVITIAEGGVVSITCETAGATIHYTAGDAPADPTEADAVFGAVTLTDGKTIKAIAVAEGYKPSAVASKKYTVGGSALVDKTATITFGTNDVKIDKASVTANDDQKNSWTITTVGTTSFTPNAGYCQVGKKQAPATSITFTTTLPEDAEVTSISAKFGGFSSTAGDVTLKVGETSVGTGALNATTDVTVTSQTTAVGNKVTITVTGIARGVKCYNIQVKYKTAN